MGCDIHAVLQRRIGGKWTTYREGWSERNYDLFAILANVRNGTGFAGTKTGDGFTPISLPRGLPRDFEVDVAGDGNHPLPAGFRAEKEWRSEDGTFWMGDHSHSWLDAREIIAVPWTNTIRQYGVIHEAVFAERRESGATGEPESYCGWIGGAGIVVLDEDQYDMVRHKLGTHVFAPRRPDVVRTVDAARLVGLRVYVRTSWVQTWAEAVGKGAMEWVGWLARDVEAFGDVRMVFGFDS